MKKLFVVGLVLLSFGCIRVQSYVKPDVNFSNIKKVAVIMLGPELTASIKTESRGSTTEKTESRGSAKLSNEPAQIVSDAIAAALAERGFDVIEKNITPQEITDSERQVLAQAGIDAIVVSSSYMSRGGPPGRGGRGGLEVSISIKMVNTKEGKLIWNASVIEANYDELNKAVKMMVDTIPVK
ncbi:MAG: DUF4136 domain-containing protein [Nitrospirota bacterium]